MAVQLIRSDDLYGGVPYAYASFAAVPSDGLVFAAGACPLDKEGIVVAPGDVQAQARQAVANLTSALGAAGANLTDVLKTTIYVASADRADLVAAWNVIRTEFGEHDARWSSPGWGCRSCVRLGPPPPSRGHHGLRHRHRT